MKTSYERFSYKSKKSVKRFTASLLLLSLVLSSLLSTVQVFADEVNQNSNEEVKSSPQQDTISNNILDTDDNETNLQGDNPAINTESSLEVTAPEQQDDILINNSVIISSPEQNQDNSRDPPVVDTTIDIIKELPLVQTKFKKDNSLSIEEELIKVRQHLINNKLPQTAIDRLDTFEKQQQEQRENPKTDGFLKKIFDFITGITKDTQDEDNVKNLIDQKPFMVEKFDGKINTSPIENYKKTFSNGIEESSLIQKLKDFIKNGKFIDPNESFNKIKENEKVDVLSWLLGGQKVYADVSDDPNDYLNEGDEITFSQAIKDKADALDNDPLSILNFVRNSIEYIPYYGSKKGADSTLVEYAGNDMDKASLLIAMFRYSDVPARYRHADIKVEIDTVTSWFGVDTALEAAQIMSLEDIPYILYTQNDDPAFFVIEHVYVEAYLPYGYSRGANVSDEGTSQWVPMEPTINQYYFEQPIDIVAEMKNNSFDIEGFFDDYLNGNYTTLEPIEAFKSEVEDQLALVDQNQYPNLTYEELLMRKYVSGELLDFIPGSLPFEISADINTYDYIPSSLRHTVDFSVKDTTNSTVINYTAYVSDIANKEILVTYEAATSGDQDTIDSFDTIYDVVPLALVNVKPKIKIGGNVVATGISNDVLGKIHKYTMGFNVPIREIGGSIDSEEVDSIEKSIVTGTTDGIALNTDRVVPDIFRPTEDTDTGSYTQDQRLYRTAVDYLNRLQMSHKELASITGGDFTNVATKASISNGVEITYNSGQPYSFEWVGLRIDSSAFVRYFNRVSNDINNNREEFMAIFGLQGSQDESDVFEDNFNVDSVATVKGLKLVAEGEFPGITLEKITSVNENDIDSLSVSTGTKTAFHDAVGDGKIIYTPSGPVTYGDWEGLFYIAIDADIGDGTYAIGEGLNGGYTIEEFPTGLKNFLRSKALIALTATINSPSNNSNFNLGQSINWSTSYDSLYYDWDEEFPVDTKNYPIGTVALKTGYGTNATVNVNIRQNPSTKIGNKYNQYDSYIVKYEDEFDIPRGLLKSIIHKETGNFEPNQYRYEPAVDYDNFSGNSPTYPLSSSHPYKQFAIAGSTSASVAVAEGSQLNDLIPKFTQVLKSRGSGGWSLRSIIGYVEGQTYAQMRANDAAPGNGTQGWPSTSNNNFTAQVVIAASYGLGHVLYVTALNDAKDMNGNTWFDETTSGNNAVSVYDMNKPEIAIRLAASTLRRKYDVYSPISSDSGKCNGWGHAVRTYNGGGLAAEKYRDDVCANYYNNLYSL